MGDSLAQEVGREWGGGGWGGGKESLVHGKVNIEQTFQLVCARIYFHLSYLLYPQI